MCVHVNTLSNELLLPIFDLIPLSELLRLDRVCLRWMVLLPSACARRHTLVLILGGWRLGGRMVDFPIPFSDSEMSMDLPAVERESSLTFSSFAPNKSFDEFLSDKEEKSSGFFDLLYDDHPTSMDSSAMDFTEMGRIHTARLSGQLATYFKDLFPKVTILVVIHARYHGQAEHGSLNELLKSSWSLNILKLWLRTECFDPDRSDHIGALQDSITQQSSLRELTLDLDKQTLTYSEINLHPLEWPSHSPSLNGRLQVLKLYLGFYPRYSAIWDLVHRFDGPALRQIGLGNYYFDPTMDTVLNVAFMPHLINTKVSQLYWNLHFESVEQLADLCGRFGSLTMLRIRWSPDITFTQLVTGLASLVHLTHLKLVIHFDEHGHPENPFAQVNRAGDGEEALRLAQIKILEFDIWLRSHQDFESLSPQVFPSVEKIILRDYSFHCTAGCRSFYIDQQSYLNKLTRCHRLLVLSVKNKFSNSLVRLYAKGGRYGLYVDWTNYVSTQEDDAHLAQF